MDIIEENKVIDNMEIEAKSAVSDEIEKTKKLPQYSSDWTGTKKMDIKKLEKANPSIDGNIIELGYDFLQNPKNLDWVRKQMEKEKNGEEIEHLHDPQLLEDWREGKGLFTKFNTDKKDE